MAEKFERKVITFDKGIWNKDNARNIPDGALVYARNCEYRGITGGISRRKAVTYSHTAVSPSGGDTAVRHMAQFKRFADTTNKLVLIVYANPLDSVYVSNAASPSVLSFSTIETGLANFDHPTSITYNDVFYYCGNSTTPRAWNGTTVRAAGITNPTPAQVPSIIAIAGTGITVANAYHVTYRSKKSTDNVVGELINGNNLILSTSYPAASGATLE